MTAYYNEIEPSAILWLQAAMDAGYIAKGDIDTRSIIEVKADDIKGYTQHHFFAGIGGWSIALRLAGWPDSKPVWTGSAPCQPYSTAGQRKGQSDERHLWPEWFRLIKEFRPATIFGEQVSSAIAFGWLDEVFDDLEAQNYSCGAAVLPACSVNAPHKRDRLWFVGDTKHDGQFTATQRGGQGKAVQHDTQVQNNTSESQGASAAEHVADSQCQRQPRQGKLQQSMCSKKIAKGEADWANNASAGLQWIECPDGKARPTLAGVRLLADGISGKLRKAALHGFGNAIVPRVAAEFIKATKDLL